MFRMSSRGLLTVSYVEDFRVDHVDGITRRIGRDLIEDVGKLDLVLIQGYVSDVRRANNVVHSEQGVVRVAQWLLFINVDGGHGWPSRAQSINKGARLDQRRPARVDQHGGGLHARQITPGDDAPR